MLSIAPVKAKLAVGDLHINSMELKRGIFYTVLAGAHEPASEFMLMVAGLGRAIEHRMPVQVKGVKRVNQRMPVEIGDAFIIDGEKLFYIDAASRAKKIGVIFETPDWSFICGTVQEDFFYSFAALGLPPPPVYSLRKYGLLEMRLQAPETLSGGEKQRLNAAAVMELAPPLVVADFSASNLDDDFLRLFINWSRAHVSGGNTVIVRGVASEVLPADVEFISIEDGIASHLGAPPVSQRELASEGPALSAEWSKRTRGGISRPRDLVISLDGVQTAYSSARLSLHLNAGQSMLVYGPNGSGKTSFGRAIVRSCIDGEARFVNGLVKFGAGVFAGMAFQHAESGLLRPTVRNEVSDPVVMDIIGLSIDERGRHPLELNRAKQKLLSVASVCANSSRLAVLDEPTCGLDFPHKLRLLRILNHYSDLAFVIFTHDAALASVFPYFDLVSEKVGAQV